MCLRMLPVAPPNAWRVEVVDGGSTRAMPFFGFEGVRPNAPIWMVGERRRRGRKVGTSPVGLWRDWWRRGGRSDVGERRYEAQDRDIDAMEPQAVADMQLAGTAPANPGGKSRFRDRGDIGPGGLVVPNIAESR